VLNAGNGFPRKRRRTSAVSAAQVVWSFRQLFDFLAAYLEVYPGSASLELVLSLFDHFLTSPCCTEEAALKAEMQRSDQDNGAGSGAGSRRRHRKLITLNNAWAMQARAVLKEAATRTAAAAEW
jgi:hypothetical protein